MRMIATSQTSGHHDSTIQNFWRNNRLLEGPLDSILAAARGSRAPQWGDKGVWGMNFVGGPTDGVHLSAHLGQGAARLREEDY